MLRDDDLLSLQEARYLTEKAYQASRQFLTFTQEQVDSIIDAMAQAATAAAQELARLAEQEDWGGEVHVYDQQDEMDWSLGIGRQEYGLLSMWWD